MINYKYVIALLAVIGAFSLGRYTVKTNTDSAVTTAKQMDKDVHTQTETTTVKQKDGSVKTVTTTDTVTTVKSQQNTKSDTKVVSSSKKLNVSLIIGYDFHQDTTVYGLSVTKELVGPFTIGVFVLSNKTAGVSLGLDF